MNRTPELAAEQRRQEEQYALPYHYLPRLEGAKFSQHAYWSWGFRYLSGLELVLDLVAAEPFDSLIDVGCGDGRFLREAALRFPAARLIGVDYSEQAIRLAQAMNPALRFTASDIVAGGADERYDVATLIEVLEHIELARVPQFVAALAAHVRPGGRLVLTVPHRNRPVESKHFQHFEAAQVEALFAGSFTLERRVFFDRLPQCSFGLRLLEKVLAGRGRYFVLTNRRLLGWCYRHYVARHLLCAGEDDCSRFALVLRKNAA